MEAYKNYSLENLDGEEWRDIEGYEGLYQVSNMGRVKGLEREYKSNNGKGTEYIGKTKTRILKQGLTTDGYPQVALCRNSTCKYVKVHKLVAKAFIPNIENKPTIDHISTVRHDNRVCNLRYFTFKEQMAENKITRERHSKIVSEWGKKNIQKIIHKRKVRCITTGKIFDSIKEASQYYNIDETGISRCCKGRFKTSGKLSDGTKLSWEYID